MSSSPSSDSEDGGDGSSGGFLEGPSSLRQRSVNGVWPEPFLENLASQIAIDATRSIGPLAVGPALFNLFQVCSTWRAVSRSDLLWQNLTRAVWHRTRLMQVTWHNEYIYHHRTAQNFRIRRYIYTTLHFDSSNEASLSCRRLALIDHHLAVGLSDGSVRLFHLPTRRHLYTYIPHHRDRLGPFSHAVSGIILSEISVVFASLDGDIHVAATNNAAPPRRAHLGDVVNDGALVDFSGDEQWWVGLYAGVPGRAFHVWNGGTEELVFIGGTLTDPEAVMGWHLLTELTELIGRVRVTSQQLAIACTSLRLIVFDLRNQVLVLGEEEFRRGIIVGSHGTNNEALVIVDNRGVANVRRAATLEEMCRFTVRGVAQRGVLGCMNNEYALMCAGGVFRVWEVEHGVYLYSLRERIGETSAITADQRHVVACSSDCTIHLWDFGAQ